MYGSAFRSMRGPGPGDGFIPQYPNGFSIPQVEALHPPMQGGGMVGGDVGGGWGGAIRRALGGLASMEGAYLASSALGGLSDWWSEREDRKLTERLEDNRRADERRHRESMGRSLNSAWGG